MGDHIENQAETRAEGVSAVKIIAGLAGGLALVFVVVLVLKIVFMPTKESYLRGCMQQTAQLTGSGGIKARMYGTFPWFSPAVEPKAADLKKVWQFCGEVYERESDSRAMYIAMSKSVEGSHPRGAAVSVIKRIDKGWSVSEGIIEQRQILESAVGSWDVNGHNPDVQRILEDYNDQVSSDARIKDYQRIYGTGKGHFSKKDICRHSILLEKWKVVSNPKSVYEKIPCR